MYPFPIENKKKKEKGKVEEIIGSLWKQIIHAITHEDNVIIGRIDKRGAKFSGMELKFVKGGG